jgi:ABC-type antimicrobial peptide transport system permease subunit
MVLRQATLLVIGGAAIGAALALGGSRFIAPLLFQTSPHDPTVYLVAIGTIVAASLIAAFGPAWRATRVDPAVALRAE